MPRRVPRDRRQRVAAIGLRRAVPADGGGKDATSLPTLTPSTWNCTPATPTSSLAVAAIVTVLLTVLPPVGCVIDTVGGVVSLGPVAGFKHHVAEVIIPRGTGGKGARRFIPARIPGHLSAGAR